MTLTEFLLARIAEDEADVADPAAALHFAPARVLAECEAKRRRIEVIQYGWDGYNDDNILGELLALEALPYADHDDFDESWRP